MKRLILFTFLVSLGFGAYAQLKIGVNAGFLNYFGGEITILGIPIEIDDIQFFPVAAAGRFTLFKFLTIGADLGFGIALINDIEGSIY